ncbi:MAG TPA: TetR/AcrR family transcriptional regulator [Solirubrobacteraceae bacterium]|jgi:AcrR family transcriptional regulator|nr:TetR/AcrR family transcriptional regulator [Solirubrobacteraceae bacterium]
MPSEPEITRARLLDAAEQLFYGRGIQAVGMDDVRSAAGLSLKRLYQLYPSKAALVQAYLDRRDVRWRGRLAEYVDVYEDPSERMLAVFDWLALWFNEPDFRGCAWINAFGELGTISLAVARQARDHKLAFRDYLRVLAADAGLDSERADQLWLLAEGAMVSAGILASPGLAQTAKSAAGQLLG